MKDNDIDNLLREKASQIDDGKYDFRINVDEIKRKAENKKKGKIIKLSFASALAACLILGILFFISRNTKPSDENIIIQGNEEKEQKEQKDYIGNNIDYTVIYRNPFNVEAEEYPDSVVIVKVTDISDNGFVDGVPQTILNGKVVEKLFGKIEGDIEFSLETCLVTNKEFEYMTNLQNEYSNNSIIRVVSNELMEDSSYPQVNKYYVATLNIDFKTNKLRVLENFKYPFYEYDPETKKVKIGDEWQDIDFNYIVW